jgi:hypothetical protein
MAPSQPDAPHQEPILAKIVGSKLRGSKRKKQSLCLRLLAQGAEGDLFTTELCVALHDPDVHAELRGRNALLSIARSIGIDPFIEDSNQLHGGMFAVCQDGSFRPMTDDEWAVFERALLVDFEPKEVDRGISWGSA